MWYVGFDIGKKWHYVVVMDQTGHVHSRQKFPDEPSLIQHFFARLEEPCRVVIEATRNWHAVYDCIEPHVQEIVLAHPLRVKAIASARIKTDRIDATTLAHLLRVDLIPRAYIPPRHVRDWRELARHRVFLVRLRTRVKNRVHALLAKRGIQPPPVSDLFGAGGRHWLTDLALPNPYATMRHRYLALLERLTAQLREVEQLIDTTIEVTLPAKLLTTLPGIGRHLALLILGEIGEVTRFPSPKHLVSYAGLCPSTYASSTTHRHGRITKQGSPWLRWALVEAATQIWRYPQSALGRRFQRLKQRRDVKTARVAVARELCAAIFHVLRKQEPYREPSSSLSFTGRI